MQDYLSRLKVKEADILEYKHHQWTLYAEYYTLQGFYISFLRRYNRLYNGPKALRFCISERGPI